MPLSDDEIKRLLARKTSRWELLERWLAKTSKTRFTAAGLAGSLKITVQEATSMIQAYLAAQRREDSETVYVLKRQGRTRGAVWSVGDRRTDAHVIGVQFYDDVVRKVERAFRPDLERLSQRNPAAARYVEQKIEAVVGGALSVLRVAVDSALEDEE